VIPTRFGDEKPGIVISMRIFIVANIDKPDVHPALDRWLPKLTQLAQVVGIDTDQNTDLATIDADTILVLGGDGTLLAVARRVAGRPIPLMGVNFGRLGFLASFTPNEFEQSLDQFVTGQLPISRRRTLEVSVVGAENPCKILEPADVQQKRRFVATALNDAVVTAGEPFHMIELELEIDGQDSVRYFGDGVIVATPSGSTAYNISAGGPILIPNVEALCITPLCPHSLSFRPVVISSHSTVLIVAQKVNPGTTLFCDGQESTRLHAGDKVIVRRNPNPVLLIENPREYQWRSLADKLHWAVSPAHDHTIR
jgi:NAD+ kinase